MQKVAKLVIRDQNNRYLLLRRSNHPTFGKDPDLPGGTWEEGETLLETVVREVEEEIGLTVDPNKLTVLYSGTEYSRHYTHYELFFITLKDQPEIHLSWEHTGYEWIDKQSFITKARSSKDTFMHMVADVTKRSA